MTLEKCDKRKAKQLISKCGHRFKGNAPYDKGCQNCQQYRDEKEKQGLGL